MTLNFNLLNAILAMDSYNRGYDPAIKFHEPDNTLGQKISNLIITSRSEIDDNEPGVQAGFFGVAYEFNDGSGQRIISYRGTDDDPKFDTSLTLADFAALFVRPNPIDGLNIAAKLITSDIDITPDVWNGWFVGAGADQSAQAVLAHEFYKNVVGGFDNILDANVSFTGHSLGGGLAGMVAGTYDKSAVVFDNMPFEKALENQWAKIIDPNSPDYDPLLREVLFGNNTFDVNLDFLNHKAFSVAGEALSLIRNNNTTFGVITTSTINETAFSLGSAFDAHQASLQSEERLTPTELHSQSLQVIRMFFDSQDELFVTPDWDAASRYLWPVLFDVSFAQQAGFDIDGGLSIKGQYDGILRAILAYSAIDEGTRVFGDTGIRALYDDANDLGGALSHAGADSTVEALGTDISKVLVQFAGQLALNKVEALAVPGALAADGILTRVDHGDNQNLILNFSEGYWNSVLDTTEHYLDTGRGQFIISMLNTLGVESDYILNATSSAWGNGSYTVFDRVVLSTTAGGTSVIEESAYIDDSKAALFLGGSSGDQVTGSSGKDFILGLAGEDTLVGGTGDDILDGGDGRDTASYLDGVAGGITVVMNGTDGTVTRGSETDQLRSIEVVEGTSGDDHFRGGDGKVLFIGGAGSDTYFLSENSSIYVLEKEGDAGTDVLLVNGATTSATYGITGARGTWVEGNGSGFDGSFFIPKAIEGVDAGSGTVTAAAYTDTYGPVPVSETVDGAYQLYLRFGPGSRESSPLVLDLDGNGITLAPLYGEGSVYFDLDNDGMAEATGWVAGNDGLLVIDKNGNGTIDNRDELFGHKYDNPLLTTPQLSRETNGFKTLKDYDTNKDALITFLDTQFEELRVWTDVNADGISQSSELHSLSSLGITEIDTSYTDINIEIEGNSVFQEGRFLMNGSYNNISDVWFRYDNLNSQYRGDFSIDGDIAALPDIRGYGQLADLQIAMSQNAELATLVSDYLDQSFAPEDIGGVDQVAALKDILYEWAGVRGLDLSHRLAFGEFYTTGNDVVFIEKYLGSSLHPNTLIYNNGVHGTYQALNNIMDEISGQIFLQSSESDYLFVQKPTYNSVTHSFEDFILDLDAFKAEIQTFAHDDIARLKYAANVLMMFRDSLGFDRLSAADIAALEDIVTHDLSNWGVTLAQASNVSVFSGIYDVWEESPQIDSLFIGRDDATDIMYGNIGNIVILGLGGDDNFAGGVGDDWLDGGDGNDLISGKSGDDTFVFSQGHDIVNDTSGFDTLYFRGDIGFSDITINVSMDNGNLLVSDNTGNIMEFVKQFALVDAPVLDAFKFESGETVLMSEIEIVQHGTEENDGLNGIESGDKSPDDVMYGYGGDDHMYGGAGNDILIGGAGDDRLNGGDGIDQAVYSGNYDDYDISIQYLNYRAQGFFVWDRAGTDGYDTVDKTLEQFVFADGIYETNGLFEDGVFTPFEDLGVDPVALDDSAVTDEDTAIIVDVLSNDTDEDGDVLTVSLATLAAHGDVVVNADGTMTYTPNAGYSGTDSFTYSIDDGNGGSDTATVTVTVMASPLPIDTSLSLGVIDGGAYGNLYSGETDADGLITASFIGTSQDLTLSLTGYDVDTGDEIEVLLNGTSLGYLSVGPNDGLNSGDTFTISAADQLAGENILTFEQTRNPVWKWGVTDILLNTVTQDAIPVIDLRDGVSVSGLVDSAEINTGSYLQKTHAVAFETGADVTTAQVMYEQGGASRGLNMFIKDGALNAAVWNKLEENWGYKEIATNIDANTKYTATFVMDGALPQSGTAELFLNGSSVGVVNGIGNLYGHADDIGIGEINGATLIDNVQVTGPTAFQGNIETLIQYNDVLATDQFEGLQTTLSDNWLGGVTEQVIMEFGSGSVDHNGITVVLDHDFINPVVFVTMTSVNESDVVAARITDIQSDSFTLYAQEAEYLDGLHALETFSYIVVEEGSWALTDGTKFEVGTQDVSTLNPNGFDAINFSTDFGASPTVLSQVQTNNDVIFVDTRQKSTTANGFQVALQEEEVTNNGSHGTETVGWFAIEQGIGSDDGFDFIAGSTSNSFTHTLQDILFDDALDELPQLLAQISTHDGNDSSFLRIDTVGTNSASLKVQEDQSKDTEINHISEVIDYFAIGGEGQLTGISDGVI